MIKLSVCIIAKNEEKMLGECLDSVSSVADEIIVIDTGSEDRTIEIARQKGAKVIESIWENDFSKARNLSISEAKGEFILIIDADERLINPKELANVIQNANPATGAWLLKLYSEINQNEDLSSNYISNLLRLFRRHKEIRFEGIVHEQVINSVRRLGLNIENTNIAINHLGYDASPEDMAKKHKRNLFLLNKALLENPNDSYNLTHRAKTLSALGRREDAHIDYLKSLEIIPKTNQMRTRSLNFGAINAFQIGNIELSQEWAIESLALIPKQTFANFILGEIYYEKRQFIKAYEHYVAMRLILGEAPDPMALISGDFSIPLDHLAYKIGRCHFNLKDYQAASDEYSASFHINMENALGLIGLANIAFNLRKYDSAKNLLETALQIDPSQKDIHHFLKQIEIATSGVNQENINNANDVSTQIVQKKLSISMIIKNEENMLGQCLDSIKDVADEIIIVDTGSGDRSIEIAESYGAKVFKFDWIDDFAAARNESLKQCTGDWILYIDADERLSKESQSYIKSYINNVLPEVGGLICTIESDHSQLDGSQEMHRGGYPRLFRNLGFPKVKFTGRVHEQISPSIVDAGYNFAVSDLKIIHLGYNQSRDVMEQKIRRNYSMLLAHIHDEPLNGYAWFQLGQTLGQMNLVKEAEDSIRFALTCDNLSDTIYSSACASLAQFTGNKGNYEESLEWAEKSLGKSPKQIFTLTLKGYALLNLGRKEAAKLSFENALSLMRSGSTIVNGSGGFDVVISEEMLTKAIERAR